VDGVSFKPVAIGNSVAKIRDYLFGEQLDLLPGFSVRDERYKLIESLQDGSIKCFDYLTDPDEKHSDCTADPATTARLKAALDLHTQSDLREARSYTDCEDNLALAVIEQRDSKGLELLAPRDAIVRPLAGNSEFQLNGRGLWSAWWGSKCDGGLCYWASAGHPEAVVTWRTEMPLTGEYDIYFKYGAPAEATQRWATNASLTVRFRAGSVAFPVDQNQNQGRWNLLGRFDHPISVSLANLADGPIVAGTVRFLRIEGK
jgi:hypothetical protein